MGSIFIRNRDQANFCHKISVPLTCMLNVLIFCFVISSTVHSLDMPLDCSKEIILTSPDYPTYYPNNIFKEWIIIAPSHKRILVTFNDFDLQNLYDFMDVKDMEKVLDGRRYTGENMRFPPFLTQGHSLQIKFTSSEFERKKGFNISVSCNQPTNASHLVDGASPSEGFLELRSKFGEWMRVCEDNLPDQVAKVICGELGYPGVKEITYTNRARLLEDLTKNFTRAPSCSEDTYRLVDCIPDNSACSSNMVVKITCNDPGYKGCFDLETLSLQSGLSVTSTAQCLNSCKSDNISAIAIMNNNSEACFCTTAAEAGLTDAIRCNENTESPSRMSVYSASVGFCDVLNDTVGGSWDSNITWFGSIVHLTCMDEYNLSGNGILQCVPGTSPLHPHWNDPIPSCVMEEVLTAEASTDGINLPPRKGGFRQSQGQTWDERRSIDPRTSRGRAVTTDSRRTPDGPSRGITARRSSGPSRPSTNNSTAPIAVISSALPRNIPRHSRPTQALPAPPVPPSHHSNTSDRPFRLLHQINPPRQNHYMSSNNEPNPYYYASSSDNQRAGSRRIEESYQEPPTVNMMNHAYEGTAEQEQSLPNPDNTDACYYASSPITPSVASTSATNPEEAYQEPSTVNVSNYAYEGIHDRGQSENLGNTDAYCYASSPVSPCVAPTSTTSPEEIYQKPSHTNKADHAYEGTTDQMQSNTSLGSMLRFGLSMISRPLPHRPSSSNCNDGPSLPPRNSSRGSRQEPSASASLRQRKPAMVNENNNIALEACSLDCSVQQKVPKKDPSLHKRTRQAETPLYHTLEKDEQQHRGHEQDNLETPTPIRLKGVMQDPLYYCLENNNNDSCSDSGIIQFLKDVSVSTNKQDSTDVTDSSGMIDNVLYTPMPSKPCNTKLSN